METKLCIKNDVLIVKFIGELDHHSTIKNRENMVEVIVNKALKNLIFDLSDIDFMDSSGIGLIIGRYKFISALGGQVKIVCNNKQIEKLITMSGLKRLVEVHTDLENALKMI